MGRDCSVTFEWGDGEYTFRLPIGQLEELEDKCDAGAIVIHDRLAARTCRMRDYRETIRLGLIGGGKTPVQALTLVKRYVDDRPIAESIMPALLILQAALVGVKDEEPGKAQAAREDGDTSAAFQTESNPSPPITESEPL